MRQRSGTLIGIIWLILLAPVTWAEVVLDSRVQKVDAGFETGVDGVYPGEILRYTIVFSNEGTRTAIAGSIVITNPLPEGTAYVDGSATGMDTLVSFSVDGENFGAPEELVLEEAGLARPAMPGDYRSIRWTFEPELAAGESGEVSFDLLIQ
jgi:uncharacterized repeat protein (TIGR01451 family)